jgi:hypothetical protein
MRFIWPLDPPLIVTRKFDYKSSIYLGGMHAAIDLICTGRPTFGAPVRAVADGLMTTGFTDSQSGHNLWIDHPGGWRTGYRHLREQMWPPGQRPVRQRDIIGFADSTGNVTGPHLHFDLWNRNRLSAEAFFKVGWWAHDPELYLGTEEDDDMTPEQDDRLKRVEKALIGGHYQDSLPDWVNRVTVRERAEIAARIPTAGLFIQALDDSRVYLIIPTQNSDGSLVLRKRHIPDVQTAVVLAGGRFPVLTRLPSTVVNQVPDDGNGKVRSILA